MERHNDNKSSITSTRVGEAFGFVVGLIWCAILLVYAMIAPVMVGSIYGPEWGVLVALFSLPLWFELGPPAGPGYLFGFLCFGGYIVIIFRIVSALGELLKMLTW